MKFAGFRSLGWRSVATSVRDGVIVGAVIAAIAFPAMRMLRPEPADSPPGASAQPNSAVALEPRFADFSGQQYSPDARHVADWVADSRDNHGVEFVIVDKKFARVYVFDADARLRGATPVLLGAAPGDDSVPGIGTRPIADIRVEERTTPAGRFIAHLGKNASLEDVVWIDYSAAVSMHRVRVTDPKERRLERLASPTSADNRISWGCINVPVAFFETMIQPVFTRQQAVVYVLPEVKDVQQVFGSYDVAHKHGGPAPGMVATAGI